MTDEGQGKRPGAGVQDRAQLSVRRDARGRAGGVLLPAGAGGRRGRRLRAGARGVRLATTRRSTGWPRSPSGWRRTRRTRRSSASTCCAATAPAITGGSPRRRCRRSRSRSRRSRATCSRTWCSPPRSCAGPDGTVWAEHRYDGGTVTAREHLRAARVRRGRLGAVGHPPRRRREPARPRGGPAACRRLNEANAQLVLHRRRVDRVDYADFEFLGDWREFCRSRHAPFYGGD